MAVVMLWDVIYMSLVLGGVASLIEEWCDTEVSDPNPFDQMYEHSYPNYHPGCHCR